MVSAETSSNGSERSAVARGRVAAGAGQQREGAAGLRSSVAVAPGNRHTDIERERAKELYEHVKLFSGIFI